jgi:catechol O-methyltransferase
MLAFGIYHFYHSDDQQDGREVDLLHYVFGRSDLKRLRGHPEKVLAAIEDYHHQFNKLMNVGSIKGAFITDIIAERKPSVMIELGGYVGYSAILFGDAIRKNGGKQYLSIEKNPEMAAVASQLVDLAGLRDIVQILVGSSNEVLKELISEKKEIDMVELIFVDHWQDLYLPDLWLLEGLDVLCPDSSLVLADNVIMPGAPEYLRWVQATSEEKKVIMEESNLGSLTPNPSLVYATVVSEFDTDFGRVSFSLNPRLAIYEKPC